PSAASSAGAARAGHPRRTGVDRLAGGPAALAGQATAAGRRAGRLARNLARGQTGIRGRGRPGSPDVPAAPRWGRDAGEAGPSRRDAASAAAEGRRPAVLLWPARAPAACGGGSAGGELVSAD